MAAIKRKRGIMDGEAINGRQSQKDKVRNKKRKKHRMGERWGNEKLEVQTARKRHKTERTEQQKEGKKKTKSCP